MKLSYVARSKRAMTLFEVFLVVAILLFLAMLLLPMLAPTRDGRGSQRISCINNLKQVNLSYRVWEGDNNDKFPMMVSVTNGGTMELITTDPEFVRDTFLVMSNELSTPKILHCPSDNRSDAVNSFSPAFTSTNISYFIGVDATDSQPQMILSGDDNLSVNGITLKSDIHDLSTNSAIAWTADRHHNCGNLGFADGSAMQVDNLGLQQAFLKTGIITNRLAFP